MPRDPAGTRQRILDAALREFADRGFSGARVDTIVAAAGVNKRMVYHYFGDKAGLFRALLEQKATAMAALRDDAPPVTGGAEWQRIIAADRDWIRLVLWEALEGNGEGPIAADEARRGAWARTVAQLQGELGPDVDAAMLLMALVSIVTYPVAAPQHADLITGLRPDGPEFQRRQGAMIARLLGGMRREA